MLADSDDNELLSRGTPDPHVFDPQSAKKGQPRDSLPISEDLPRLENRQEKAKTPNTNTRKLDTQKPEISLETSTREDSREQSRRRPLQEPTLNESASSTPCRPPGLSLGRDPSPWGLDLSLCSEN